MVDVSASQQAPGAPALAQPAAQAKGSEQKLEKPVLGGFTLPGRRVGEIEDIIDALSPLSSLKTVSDGERVAVLNVESRDIKRSPYLFSTVYFAPDSVSIVYSVVPGVSLRRRSIDVLRHVLNLLTLLDGIYAAEQKPLYQSLQSALQELTEFASSEYSEIFAKYDFIQRDNVELKGRADSLESTNQKVSKEIIEVRAHNDELTVKLNQLEVYSDETLMARLQDWLDVHRNEVNIAEFAKQHGVPESRVEQVLNAMVVQGYLELRS